MTAAPTASVSRRAASGRRNVQHWLTLCTAATSYTPITRPHSASTPLEVARDLYDPVLTTALETARADQERAERFVSPTDKLAAVAFDYPECAIACVINTRSINQHRPSSYNRGVGALGVLGTIEPGHGDLRLIAPLHIWWQNGAD